MSFWTAIVLIVAIIATATFLKERAERRSGGEGQKPVDTRREEQLEAEVTELKERIKVLERIAYDDRKRVGLADEIESLRD